MTKKAFPQFDTVFLALAIGSLFALVFYTFMHNGLFRAVSSMTGRVGQVFGISDSKSKETTASVEQYSAFASKLKPIYTKPSRLFIETLGIDLAIISVGVAEDGSLETPKNWNEAGWYSRGSMPGENGNLLINAHYDDNFGRPAAFWQLKNAKAGDKVSVEDEFGKVYTYTITEVFYIDINDPARLQVFDDDTSVAHLTLITCGGVWLPGQHTYTQRLIVKGELSQ